MNRPACFVLAIAIALLPSCRSREGDDGRSSSSSGDVDAGGFDKASLLSAFGQCALGTYREFADAASALETATRTAETDPTPASLEAAQTAWKNAMRVWQRAELFQFGPAAASTTPGGQDMRDPIYAWPLAARCLTEQNIVARTYESPSFPEASLVSTRSLAIAEYLLFYTAGDNACPPENTINANGEWAALGMQEIQRRKAAYARVVATDVAARARRLVDAWDPTKGNFLATFAGAGTNSTFASQQMAFNAVSDAMFYLDLQVKNLKIGTPAGLLPGCAAPPCLDMVESPWANVGKENIRANVAAYTQLLRGCDASSPGFDDLLIAIGAQPVAEKLDTTVASIEAALDALAEPTLQEDLQKNPAGVQALFEALRANAAVMKADFATVLDLELPKAALSDND